MKENGHGVYVCKMFFLRFKVSMGRWAKIMNNDRGETSFTAAMDVGTPHKEISIHPLYVIAKAANFDLN